MAETRPSDLPEFATPPLVEVVLGVQFSAPSGYGQVHVGRVWELFRERFPLVQEMPAIPPSFETFGPVRRADAARLQLVSGPLHDRFWFKTRDGTELVQFQADRFVHNWKKVEGVERAYPRYEAMRQRFRDELEAVQAFFQEAFAGAPGITQCELTYVNHIRIGAEHPAHMWFSFIGLAATPPDDLEFKLRYVIPGESGAPIGRLVVECEHAFDTASSPVLRLTLSARGAPDGDDLQSALRFMDRGRARLVTLFAELTSPMAHVAWGRVDGRRGADEGASR